MISKIKQVAIQIQILHIPTPIVLWWAVALSRWFPSICSDLLCDVRELNGKCSVTLHAANILHLNILQYSFVSMEVISHTNPKHSPHNDIYINIYFTNYFLLLICLLSTSPIHLCQSHRVYFPAVHSRVCVSLCSLSLRGGQKQDKAKTNGAFIRRAEWDRYISNGF